MAKVGDYRYPTELDPQDAQEVVDVLVNEYGGAVKSREAFAQSLGHKNKNSGSFNRKIADSRKYGVMTPRGEYEATELGKTAANPRNSSEKRESFYKMLENIDILQEIERVTGGNEPDGEFWRIIKETAGVNPKEAKEAAPRISDLYSSLLKYHDPGDQSTGETEQRRQTGSPANHSEESPSATEVKSDVDLYLKLGQDELTFQDANNTKIRLAISLLEEKMSDGGDNNSDQPEETGEQAKLSE